MDETDCYNICRLCLENSNFFANIFIDQSSDSNPVYELVNYVYDLEISVDDGLPEYICQKCFQMVNEFQLYKFNVHKAKSILKQRLKKITIKVEEEEVDISDDNSFDPLMEEENLNHHSVTQDSNHDEDDVKSTLFNRQIPYVEECTSLNQSQPHVGESIEESSVGSQFKPKISVIKEEALKSCCEEPTSVEQEVCDPSMSNSGAAPMKHVILLLCKKTGSNATGDSSASGVTKEHVSPLFVQSTLPGAASALQEIKRIGVDVDGRTPANSATSPPKKQPASKFQSKNKYLNPSKMISNKQRKCSICQMVFCDMEMMLKHKERHYKNNMYVCLLCSMSFETLAPLKRHADTHMMRKSSLRLL